jgi:uncharacterized protein with HEPN domain
MEIDQLGRLRDILEAARLIGTYVKTTTESDFYADKQKQDESSDALKSSVRLRRT